MLPVTVGFVILLYSDILLSFTRRSLDSSSIAVKLTRLISLGVGVTSCLVVPFVIPRIYWNPPTDPLTDPSTIASTIIISLLAIIAAALRQFLSRTKIVNDRDPPSKQPAKSARTKRVTLRTNFNTAGPYGQSRVLWPHWCEVLFRFCICIIMVYFRKSTDHNHDGMIADKGSLLASSVQKSVSSRFGYRLSFRLAPLAHNSMCLRLSVHKKT